MKLFSNIMLIGSIGNIIFNEKYIYTENDRKRLNY